MSLRQTRSQMVKEKGATDGRTRHRLLRDPHLESYSYKSAPRMNDRMAEVVRI